MTNEGYGLGLTEFALGLSPGVLAALADQAGLGLWNWNVTTDELRLNEIAVKMVGYEKHELLHSGTSRLAVIFEEDRALVEENVKACLDGRQDGYKIAFRLNRKDGSIVSVLESAFVCERDSMGKALRMGAMVMDLSALRHAEQRIQSLEKENRILRDEGISEGELATQVHMLRAVNAAAAGAVGGFYRNYEISLFQALAGIGESFSASALYVYRNVVGNTAPACYLRASWQDGQTLPAPLDSKMCWAYEDFLPGRLGDLRMGKSLCFAGKDIPASLQVLPGIRKARGVLLAPLLLHGGFWGLLRVDDCTADRLFTETEAEIAGAGTTIIASSIARNETLDKLNEARKAAMASTKSKSEFLARMSHEIRTPMNAIIGLSSIARKSGDLQQIKGALEKMDVASKQLLGIINDVLDMSKIDSGRLEISAEPFDFDRMLQNMLNVIRVRLDEKFQRLHIEVDDRFTRQVISDELRLSQVLINLLSNAVKFTPVRGEINLKVRCDPGNSPDAFRLRVEVSDTGVGIGREAQKKLFTPFEQADGGMSRRFGGTGLGLAISKSIVNMMGGKIWVKSEVGEGTTFSFEIPARWGKPLDSGAADLRQMHILVVDDSALARQYFTTMLESFQQVCETAESGEKAVEMIMSRCEEKRPYDICFLDWNMPGMNGGKTARTIRHIAGDATTLVMVTVSDWADIEQEARSHGITHYLPKPVLPTVLYNRLMELSKQEPPNSGSAAGLDCNWRGKAVLLVEDIEINREIMFGLLEDTGLEIVTAENGQEAVDKFTAQPDKFSAILMDVQMPVKDGLTAAREIRALQLRQAGRIPIIAMTANAFKEDQEASLEAGMNEHIAKPIEVETLFTTLARYLAKE